LGGEALRFPVIISFRKPITDAFFYVQKDVGVLPNILRGIKSQGVKCRANKRYFLMSVGKKATTKTNIHTFETVSKQS
jgi:hypothetical protein